MQALRFEKFGDLTNLKLQSVADPLVGPGEVLVAVEAASLNPSDAKNVLGRMEGTTLPRTPGRDFSGTVMKGPDHLLNKAIWGTGGDIGFTKDGSHAEFLVVPAEGVALKPGSLSMEQAASVGVNFVTAWLGIEALNVNASDTLLVTGAGGGVGTAVIQLAKWRGARVIALDRTPDAQSRARSNGADLTLAFQASADSDGLSVRIHAMNSGKGVSAVFDTVGGPLFEPCLRCLEHEGRQVNITSVGDRRVSFDLLDFYHHRLTLKGVDSRALDTVKSAAILRQLTPGFESAALKPQTITYKLKLENGSDAYRQIEDGKIDGKAVFLIPH